MRGKKAKALRKEIYGDNSSHVKVHSETTVLTKKTRIPKIVVHADKKRKDYQALKKVSV